ncbi:MAG: nitroreductase family protein [Lachnospiraceae bacterium]|nr:nitroreductase family protein [Robinsoniella sp.]MDY3765885.1 nitroreductase family protein [Lachnospiraceae bacterium]
MNLYESIYVRKSVRHFKMETINQEVIEKLKNFIAQIDSLFPEIKTKVEILDNINKKEKLKGMLVPSAPYYLVIYSEEKEKYDLNAGYIMEQISLYMTSKGIGSCFLGMAKSPKQTEENELHFVIGMAFGMPKGEAIRHDYEAKRLSLEELCVFKETPKTWVKEILEAARLAPSSFNSQPWRFVVYENRIHVFSKKAPSSKKNHGKYNEFNFGVMLANISIAAEEIWVDLDLIKLNNITHKTIPNNQYVISILIKQ